MGRDGKDGDDGNSLLAFHLVGAVMPEDAVGAGGVVLCVGLEDFLAMDARQRCELVRTEARMARVYFEVSESLANLREERSLRQVWEILQGKAPGGREAVVFNSGV